MGLPPFRKWVLPASLALNVFLGTVIVMHPRPPRHGPHDPGSLADKIAEALPPADAAILRQAVAAHVRQLMDGDRAQHQTPEVVKALLAAPTLDEAALRDTLAAHHAARQAMDEALAAIITETVTRISPEGRAALAKWRPPGPPFGGPPPGGPPPGGFGGPPPR
jgi:uncharacterized membrane protein